jgi:hypothetical protein
MKEIKAYESNDGTIWKDKNRCEYQDRKFTAEGRLVNFLEDKVSADNKSQLLDLAWALINDRQTIILLLKAIDIESSNKGEKG